MINTLYYNIHNLVAFQIAHRVGLLDRLFPDWDIELQGFASEKEDAPDFTVLLDRFAPDNDNCVILDNDCYVREDYLYCRDSYKYARWELEMSGFERSPMTVRIHSNCLGKSLIPELVLNHLIWLKLNEKGFPVVHGSAVSREGKAYVFAAPGAAGKSTIALNLVERGFQLLNEHFTVLDRGMAWSFPTPFHIMDFNLAPIIRKNMSLKHKASFQLRQLFHRLTGRRLATKILPRDIIPNSLADKAILHSVFLLLPRDGLRVESIGKEELIRHLVMNQKLESASFMRYMTEYAYMFPRSRLATYWARYEENLGLALDTAQAFYRLEVPLKYSAQDLDRISELVCKR